MVRSWQTDKPEEIRCQHPVQKQLVTCEHSATLACSSDPAKAHCRSRCEREMSCCGKQCTDSCGQCQRRSDRAVNGGLVVRTKHADHHCGRGLYCQHGCRAKCTDDHDCSDVACSAPCRQTCVHHTCKRPCSEPCPPCMEPCLWKCEHHVCPVVCGAVSLVERLIGLLVSLMIASALFQSPL